MCLFFVKKEFGFKMSVSKSIPKYFSYLKSDNRYGHCVISKKYFKIILELNLCILKRILMNCFRLINPFAVLGYVFLRNNRNN